MTKRTERAERTQGKNGAGPELAHLVEPMLAGMSSTRQHLLAWVHAQGLAALDELFREEAVALAGPKGRQQAQRTHHHWGTTATELTVIVVLGITRDGGKVPLGLRLGSTENAVVCTELLQDLLARGLTLEGRVLWVIDGGKGLRKALGDVFGDAAVIQRCQLHKGRHLDALVPKARQAYVRAALRRGYRGGSAAAARRQLTALATWLERNGHVDAAASVREGLDETLTLLKLGVPPTPRRFFATTNCIENLIGTLRHVTRNITRWRDGDMRRRWIGLGLLRAAERFRRIKRHGELGALVTALGAVTAAERAA